MWLDSERKCNFVMMVAVVLLVGSLFCGLASLEQGYAANKVIEKSEVNTSSWSSAVQTTGSNGTDYYSYSELTDAQQAEFDSLREGEKITQIDALLKLEDPPIRVQDSEARYIIEYGFLPSFESYWLVGLSGLGVLVSLFGLVVGYERKVEVRLEKLYENPEEVIDEVETDW